MVDVQPTKETALIDAARGSAPEGAVFLNLFSAGFLKRFHSFLRRASRAGLIGVCFCRLNLNHPPTAVGGILTFCAKRAEILNLKSEIPRPSRERPKNSHRPPRTKHQAPSTKPTNPNPQPKKPKPKDGQV
jgi:hypothetical protein